VFPVAVQEPRDASRQGRGSNWWSSSQLGEKRYVHNATTHIIRFGDVVKFETRDGKPIIVRLPEIDFIDDKAGKPVGIHKFIGRRPIAAFDNSDGDHQMRQWTMAGKGARLAVLIHHTDAKREWTYDCKSKIGHLDKAWTVVDMRQEWKVIYPFQMNKQ